MKYTISVIVEDKSGALTRVIRPSLPRTGVGVDVHAFAAEPGAPLHCAER